MSALSQQAYCDLSNEARTHPEVFWANEANRLIDWSSPFTRVMEGDFSLGACRWFIEGELNPSYNCLDRHLPALKDKVAYYCEGNFEGDKKTLTYGELFEATCRFANVLKAQGIKKGDRVAIYLPMIIEAVVAMLACVRIGAIHTVIFAGFSADAIRSRVEDCQCTLVVTATEFYRGDKPIFLKKILDEALQTCASVRSVIVVQGKHPVRLNSPKEQAYETLIRQVSATCPVESLNSDDSLFILYTSGSTGKPKGILHSVAGYLVYVASTFDRIFQVKENECYWCTADVGWITGHSYVVYGPLLLGVSSVLYEGIPNYPNPGRLFEMIDRYQVTHLYTSPTAIRAMRQAGDVWVNKSSRKSLRWLGSVGEPINPEVWNWYDKVVGAGHCVVVDTWWQTETGGVMIAPIPGITPLVPGSATFPYLAVEVAILDDAGKPVGSNKTGKLVLSRPWPGMMKTIYGDPNRFFKAYFESYPGFYLTGDDAYFDQQGNVWIVGRNDDVLKVSGHRLGSAEIENVFLLHDAVAEAAVVGVPHPIKGEAIFAFVSLKNQSDASESLKKALIAFVRQHLSAIATPDQIQWAASLPKTRSGKIMRRLLRKIASHDIEDLGDLSTLADLTVIQSLLDAKK